MAQRGGMSQQVPAVDLGGLGGAVGTVLVDGLLGGDDGREGDGNAAEGQVGCEDVDLELAGKDGAGRGGRAVEEGDWRRLDDQRQPGSLVRLGLGILLVRMMPLAQAVALERIHDERVL